MDVKRRGFFQGVAGGTLGLAGFLYPGITEIARAQRSPGYGQQPIKTGLQPDGTTALQVGGSDPTYAGGQVASITGANITLTSAAGSRTVIVAPDTQVWKETVGSINMIEVGDWLDVKGTPQADGTLVAQSGMVFANIARLDGVLTAVDERAMTMTVTAYGSSRTCELSSLLETIRKEDGTPYPGGIGGIPAGTMVGAVGLGLSDGGFRATRVWV